MRICYVIIPDQKDEKGFIPSIVFEGEKGHNPMTGKGVGALPWHWGTTLAGAEEICRRSNEELGLTKEDVNEIILSSF